MTIYDVLKQLAEVVTKIVENYDPYGFRDSMNLEDDFQTAIDETYLCLLYKDTCITDTLSEIVSTYKEDGEEELETKAFVTLLFVETLYEKFEY